MGTPAGITRMAHKTYSIQRESQAVLNNIMESSPSERLAAKARLILNSKTLKLVQSIVLEIHMEPKSLMIKILMPSLIIKVNNSNLESQTESKLNKNRAIRF